MNDPRDVITGYFKEMHDWEEACVPLSFAHDPSTEAGMAAYLEFRRCETARRREIWERFCYGEFPYGDELSCQTPAEYGETEKIETCDITGNHAVIVTSGRNSEPWATCRTVYKLKLTESEWRIVSRHDLAESGKKKKLEL